MAKKTKNIGNFSEKLAKDFLERRGYYTLQQNTIIGRKEIDLIMKCQNSTVFVEVKSRTSNRLGEADTALTSKQLQTLKKAISQYCAQNRINKNFIRLDLIAVDIDSSAHKARIKHYKDIF